MRFAEYSKARSHDALPVNSTLDRLGAGVDPVCLFNRRGHAATYGARRRTRSHYRCVRRGGFGGRSSWPSGAARGYTAMTEPAKADAVRAIGADAVCGPR